jgi:hypothetical protein
MPSEERRITFSETETANAVQRHIRRRDSDRSTVEIRHVRPTSNGQELTGAHVSGHIGLERIELDLSVTELSAALLGWCLATNVPIPRQAQKFVDYAKGRFVLGLRVQETRTPAAE